MRTSLALVFFLGACGGGDGGTAPAIADLTFAPATIPAATVSTVSGTMTFTDEDGDVEELGAAITPPGGSRQETEPVPVQTGDAASGTVTWAVAIQPPVAGSYLLELWVIDGGGNESNNLTATITAQ